MERKSGRYHGEPRLTIGVLMLMTAGAALGIWLTVRNRGARSGRGPEDPNPWLFALVFLLGGLSLVGVPLLLATARACLGGREGSCGSLRGRRPGCYGRRLFTGKPPVVKDPA